MNAPGCIWQNLHSYISVLSCSSWLDTNALSFFSYDLLFRQGFVVSKLFQPEVLQIWIKKMSDEKNIEMIILLSLLNQWLSPFLSEASDYGVNSYSAEVEYFRGLARWLGQQYCYIYYVFCFSTWMHMREKVSSHSNVWSNFAACSRCADARCCWLPRGTPEIIDFLLEYTAPFHDGVGVTELLVSLYQVRTHLFLLEMIHC